MCFCVFCAGCLLLWRGRSSVYLLLRGRRPARWHRCRVVQFQIDFFVSTLYFFFLMMIFRLFGERERNINIYNNKNNNNIKKNEQSFLFSLRIDKFFFIESLKKPHTPGDDNILTNMHSNNKKKRVLDWKFLIITFRVLVLCVVFNPLNKWINEKNWCKMHSR